MNSLSLTSQTKIMILIFDGILFCISMMLIYFLRFGSGLNILVLDWGLWLILFSWLSALYIFGQYDLDKDEGRAYFVGRMFISFLVSLITGVLLVYLSAQDRSGIYGRGVLVGGLLLNALASLLWRGFLRNKYLGLQSNLRLFVLTTDSEIEAVKADFAKNHFTGLAHYLLPQAKNGYLSWKDLFSQLTNQKSLVVLASETGFVESQLGSSLIEARFQGHPIMDISSFYETRWRKIPIFHLGAKWFFLNDGFSLIGSPLRMRVKRLSDLVISFLLLIVVSPLMILTALAVVLDSPGPALYRQKRTGKDGEDFIIYKFRSMRTDAEIAGAQWAKVNDNRVTRIGNFIRKTRLDELPQLFNVIKGEMSFIGPRPERPEFNSDLSKQIPYYNFRHLVRPGITGWAQVMYPYGASLDDAIEKLQYDLYYIKNFSFVFDIQIFLKTISVVLLGKGR